MIRAHRVNATAQDDAMLIVGWNIAPNVAYILRLFPGVASCGVLLYDEGNILVATGAALAGTDQPCVLTPQAGQTIEMVDAELGWHLLLTTSGTEAQREIRINPSVDLPDEIHPVYGDDDMAIARATAAIDESAHYRDDVTATCLLGLGASLGDVVRVPVDGAAVVGQVESVTWTATPDGAPEQVVIRRHVAIAPESFVEPILPIVADDTGTATHLAGTSGNVLTNDATGLTVTAVNGLFSNVGVAVDGDNGGTFTIDSDGSWTFAPDGDFVLLSGSETADTSVTYHASDGTAEAMATLTVTVSHGNAAPVAVDDVGATAANVATTGNVLANDTDADGDTRTVSQVAGSASNVGVAVVGSNGGLFTIASDGAWTFDPDSDFDTLTGEQTVTTSVTYHVSDGVDEDEGTLTVTVSAAVSTGDITLIGSVTANGTGTATLTLPAGIQAGDLVLVMTGFSATSDGDPGVSTPSGYIEIFDLYSNDNNDANLSISYKIMGASPDENVVVSGLAYVSGCCYVFRGVNSANPLDVTPTSAVGANSRYPDCPPITPVTDQACVIAVGAYAGSSSVSGIVISGFENYLAVGDGVTYGIKAATTIWSSGDGEIDPALWTGHGSSTSSSWVAATIALRPA